MVLILALAAALLSGCYVLRSRHPVPEPWSDAVQVVGIPGDVRMCGDRQTETLGARPETCLASAGCGRPSLRQASSAGRNFVICDNRVDSAYEPVDPRIRTIGWLAVRGLTQARAVGDLWQAYVTCWRDWSEFRLATIPQGVSLPGNAIFDERTALDLFDCGYELARVGFPWATAPPGVALLDPPPTESSDAEWGRHHPVPVGTRRNFWSSSKRTSVEGLFHVPLACILRR